MTPTTSYIGRNPSDMRVVQKVVRLAQNALEKQYRFSLFFNVTVPTDINALGSTISQSYYG